ncbi:hypothetical protein NQ318_014605 [Aromia moschata]|uniref:Uncharacterized protein n=1 Tax=Aromia moschata TaxID=1265417 RepID=A0AAV8ZBN4_9CUCU|nr:hypothetical protein NQ318_014605 [Aromia moschata]
MRKRIILEEGQKNFSHNKPYGDAILCCQMRQSIFRKKLAPRYIGPFYVKKKLSPWTYELENTDGRSAGVWNAKDLKSAASAVENLQGNIGEVDFITERSSRKSVTRGLQFNLVVILILRAYGQLLVDLFGVITCLGGELKRVGFVASDSIDTGPRCLL